MADIIEKVAGGVAIAANAAGTLVVVLLIAVVNYDIIARDVLKNGLSSIGYD